MTAKLPGVLVRKVRVLEDGGRRRATDDVATLHAVRDGFADARPAADAVGVFAHTFGYRVRRLSDLARLHLDDPAQRSVAQHRPHLLR